MELNEFTEEAARRHIERSMRESKDADKLEQWKNGERAREQAEQIVAELVNEALKAIEPGEQSNAG